MFLKNVKKISLICCILAALCLTIGFILSGAGDTVSDALYETMAMAAESEGIVSYTEGEFTETDYAESGGMEPEEGGLFWRAQGPAFIGRLLLLTGSILAVVFVFFIKQEQPFLGPELELILFFLSLSGIRRPLYGELMIDSVYLWLLFCLLLVYGRGLWSWFRAGFSFEWSGAHRFGLMVAEFSKKSSRYLVTQLIVMIFGLAGMTALLAGVGLDMLLGLAGVACLFGAIMSGFCFLRRSQDEDHLVEQIRQLHEGNPVSLRNGAFVEDEKKLIDLNRQRDEAIQKAVISERFKVDLIANVSHDLRTPLTAILGYGELLEEEKLSPKGEKQLQELNRKAGYMRDLVESLFELTKVSSGAAESRKDEIDLIRLLEQTLGLFDDQLSKKGLKVRRHYGMESLPVVTDGARMHQVFANLIGNAIKYTLPGTRIHLEVKESEQFCSIRMVNIASYEMDFDPEEILQRFARGDKARTTKGSGLGLAIAQTYTESVGGTFRVEIDGEQFSAIVTLPKK